MGEIRESVILEVKADGAVQTSAQLATAFDRLTLALGKIEDSLVKTQKESKDLSVAEREAAVAIDKATTSTERNAVATDRLDKSTGRASVSVRQMVGGWRSAAQASQGFLSPMLRLSAILGAGLGVQRAIGDLASFERGLTQVGAVSGATAAEIERIKQVSLELGATTSKSASEALQGAVNLAKAGFAPGDIPTALPAALNLAVTAQLDLGRASEITANTLAQFGLQADAAVRVSDALTVASQKAATDVAQLADGMVYAGTIAGAFGIPLEDAAAAMAALAQGGLQGSIAGRGLAGVLSRMIDPSREAAQELERVGVSVKDLDPRTAGLAGSVQTLGTALSRGANIFALFDQEQAKSALTLAKQVEKFDEVREAIKGVSDVAGQQKDAFGKDLQGALTTLSSTLEAVTLRTGDRGLSGALKSTVGFATETVRALGSLDQEGERVSVSASLAASAIEGLVAAASVGAIARFATSLAALSNPVTAVAAAFGAAVTAGSFFAQMLQDSSRAALEASADVKLFQASIQDVETRLGNFRNGPLTVDEEIQKQAALAQAARRVRNEIEQVGAVEGRQAQRFDSVSQLEERLRAAQAEVTRYRERVQIETKRIEDLQKGIFTSGPDLVPSLTTRLQEAEVALRNIVDARALVGDKELIPTSLIRPVAEAAGKLRELEAAEKSVTAGFVPFSFAAEFLDQIASSAGSVGQALRETAASAKAVGTEISAIPQQQLSVDDLVRPLREEVQAFETRSAAVAKAIAEGRDYRTAIRDIEDAEESSIRTKEILAQVTASGSDAGGAASRVRAEAEAYVAARRATEDYIAAVDAQLQAQAKASQQRERDADAIQRQIQADSDRAASVLANLELEAASYVSTRDEVERLALEEDLRHLQVTAQTKDRIRGHLEEVQSLRRIREATDAIASGATDALRALKDGGTGSDAAQAALQGISDRLFQNATAQIEELLSSSLANLFVDPAEDFAPTVGDTAIVSAVNQVTQAIYATAGAGNGTAVASAGAGAIGGQFSGGSGGVADFGDPGFQGPPSNFNAQGAGTGGSFAGAAAGAAFSFALQAIAYSMRDKPKEVIPDRGPGFDVLSQGAYVDNRRITIEAPKRDRALQRTARQIIADRNRT